MCVPGAITATSAAMVMRKPADAARLPAGDTKTDDRGLRLDDGGVDVARRVDETAGRAEHDDEEIRLRRVRLGNRAADVGRGDGMDDTVHLGGVDDRRALRGLLERARASRVQLQPCRLSARHEQKQQAGGTQALATRMASS